MKSAWQGGRWALAGLVCLGTVSLLVDTVRTGPDPGNVSFDDWYGNWSAVLVVTGVFTLFTLGFVRPRRLAEWRNAGVYTAFLISLFTEMFGLPLTIYLLAPLLGFPPSTFGLSESHLWAFALDRLGLLPLPWGAYLVMVASMALIGAGASLVAVGWAALYRGRTSLVTGGVYGYVRHPQYLGLIAIVAAFTIQWPTVLTLVMAPVLILMYVRLARGEDERLAARFGDALRAYAARTPAFLTGRRPVDRIGSAGEGESPDRRLAPATQTTAGGRSREPQ